MDDLLELLPASRMRIVTLIKRCGTATTHEAAEATGLAVTTVRQHLEQLLAAGIVAAQPVITGPGRPTLRYVLTARGERLFPSQNAALFGDLLERLVREGQMALVEDFFREAWAERREELTARIDAAGAQTLTERLAVLRGFLDDQGFVPEVETGGGCARIRECNCPLSRGVAVTRLPCRLEAELLSEALQCELTRVSYIPDGDPTCTYELALD